MSLLRRKVRRTGPLRILFVVPDLRLGGAEQHVVTLAPALDQALFEVSVVCIGKEGALFPALVRHGVTARALHSRRNPLRALVQLVRLMRRVRPDVVITRGYSADTLGRLAATLTRVPRAVVWMHNSTDITPRGLAQRVTYRVLDAVTSAYYGVTDAQRGYLVEQRRYPVRKIEIVENGIDVNEFRPPRPGTRHRVAASLGVQPAAPTIGLVARLYPEKDHRTAMLAMQMVLDEIPDARLALVGDGPLQESLEEFAEQLGIAGSVVFAGFRPDVGDVLAALDVVLLSSYTECLPLSVLEAMACEIPVVATAVGGVPDIVDDGVTGLLVPSREPRAMADALIKILRDPERMAAMGRAGRRRVEESYTLERSVGEAQRALLRTAGRERTARPIRVSIVQDEVDTAGGAERLLLSLCAHLDRSVVEPRLICLRYAGEMRADFEAAGVPVEVLGRRGRFDPTTLVRLVRSFTEAKTDVVLVTHHHKAAMVFGRIAARIARVHANVVAAHDMDVTRVGDRVLPRSVLETLFLSDALVLLAPSQGRYLHDEEGVGRLPWRRTREVVIPNGIAVRDVPTPADRLAARARLGVDPADLVVGIVAIFREQKAHHILLRAIAQLAPTNPRLRLVAVGDGPEENRARALAEDLGIADRVLFTGLRDDVAEILPGFDVSCLSSVHEGAPLVVLESMAAGVPMVVTDCGALRDLIADSREGFIVPVGDPEALADRLAALLADPGLREEMGARARARAEREFSIEHTVEGYRRLFEGLVSR